MIDRATELQPMINSFCCSNENVRMEIIATSLLPQGIFTQNIQTTFGRRVLLSIHSFSGSGLGTSSILAGCVVAAISKCIGASRQTPQQDIRDIINSVLSIEQYLTTGGGYQDQVNGLIGGIKVVSSAPNGNPMTLSIDHVPVSEHFRRELDKRLVLVYTGTTRLAKNLLRNVLRRWAKRTLEIVKTVSRLVEGSKKCRDAIDSANVDLVGECLSEYWEQKKIMAGSSSGVAPKAVSEAMATLHKLGLVRGASLCGAGGGGFMVLLTAEGVSQAQLKASLLQHGISNFTWYDCCISQGGLSLRNLGPAIENFDIKWLISE
jgi:fucokinase